MRAWLERIRETTVGRWLMRMAVWGCAGIAAGYFLLVALMLWRGKPWAWGLYAERPYAHLAGGLAFLFLAYLLHAGYRNSARAWGVFAGKCLLLTVATLLAFGVGELVLRRVVVMRQQAGSIEQLRKLKAKGATPPIRSDHPLAVIIELSDDLDLVYELQPHLDMEFGHRKLRTNQHGMRADKDFTLEKPAGVRRIVGIGDSGMFGWDVEQGEPYMSVLDDILNAGDRAPHYEVMNLAVPGYNTALEVQSLVYKGLQFAPDVVIVGWCDNDFHLPFFMLEEIDFSEVRTPLLHSLMFDRARFRELALGRRVRSLRDVDESNVEPGITTGRGAESVVASFKQLMALAEQEGFHVLVFGAMTRDITERLDRLKVPYFNTREKLSAGDYPPDYAIHFMHPSADGHRVLGQALAEELDRRGWLGASSGF